MTPEIHSESDLEPKGMGEGSRLAGVFFEPGKAFEDIAKRPGFWAPLALVILVSLIYMAMFGQHVGWERMIRHQMELSPQAMQLPADRREAQIAAAAKFTPIATYGFILIVLPLFYLIWAAVLLAIVKGMMSAPVRLKQLYAILWYASLPGIIMAVLAIAVMFMKSPDDFNLQNPLVFNPAAFMDQAATSKFVYSIASALDLFSLWKLVLIAIGVKAAGGKNMSMGGALTATLLPWAIWTLCAAALAGIFSR